MSGLPVSSPSKTYERATFGFMQKQKSKAYKLNCPYPGGESGKVLGNRFDPGITHFATKLNDSLLLTGPGSKAERGGFWCPYAWTPRPLSEYLRSSLSEPKSCEKRLLRFSRFPNLLLLFGSLIPVGVS